MTSNLRHLFSVILLGCATLHADTVTVTNGLDAAPPPPGSLRHAIASANSGDTIVFAPEVTGTITLAGAELVLDKNLAITGPGAAVLAISGDQKSRVFRIPAGATVTLTGFTIRNGKAPPGTDALPGAGEPGGGILNAGSLTVGSCSFTNNSAGMGGTRTSTPSIGGDGGNGGAIANALSGTLHTTRCVFTGNTAGAGGATVGDNAAEGGNGGSGGAICHSGSNLSVDACTFSGNTAGAGGQNSNIFRGTGGFGGSGGGIYIDGGTANVGRSTFIQNSGGDGGSLDKSSALPIQHGSGGGIAVVSGAVAVATCTITANKSGISGERMGDFSGRYKFGAPGGGIACIGGELTITSCTIVRNSVFVYGFPVQSPPSAFAAAGLDRTSGNVRVSNTIIAENTLIYQPTSIINYIPSDVRGSFTSLGHNLVGNISGATGFDPGVNGDITGVSPLLGDLADVGGSTQVHPLLPGSPAADAGDDLLTAPDQRGQPRPIGHHVDIGAYEAEESTPTSTVSFLSPSSSHWEETWSASIPLVRAGEISEPVTVHYALTGGTASKGTDFTINGATTVPAGESQGAIPVTIQTDYAPEANETIQLTLIRSSPNAEIGTANIHTLTILDDETPGQLEFSLPENSVTENNGTVQITIRRVHGSIGPVTVTYQTLAGTADSDDFTMTTGVVEFAHGEFSRSIQIAISNDSTPESTENFSVVLSNPTGGATLAPQSSCNVSILDDEKPIIYFSSADRLVSEGVGTAYAFIERTTATYAASVSYATAAGTASQGSDYSAASEIITFAAGEKYKTILIPITDDTAFEKEETFTIILSSPTGGSVIGEPSICTVTIADNEPPPLLSFAASAMAVSETAPKALLKVKRTGDLAGIVAVTYQTAAETATAGEDFAATIGTLTFAPNVLEQTIELPLLDDNATEGLETFTVTLSAPTNDAILGAQSTIRVTVVSEDGRSTVHSVTTMSDNVTNPPPGSLRAAIAAAFPLDEIEFAPGLTGAITLAGAELMLDKSISIIGPGANLLAISGNQQSRIFNVLAGVTVTISGVTIRDGKAADGALVTGGTQTHAGNGQSGGGILNGGILTLVDCILSDNTAGKGGDRIDSGFGTGNAGAGGSGGAIFNSNTLVLSRCKLINNRAGNGGIRQVYSTGSGAAGNGGNGGAIAGGIYTELLNCTLDQNRAGNGGMIPDRSGANQVTFSSGGSGGGIYIAGTALIEGCSFVQNVAGTAGLDFLSGVYYRNGGAGGGLAVSGIVTLKNCSISKNAAGYGGSAYPRPEILGGSGGGVAAFAGNISLISCTIFDNATGLAFGLGGSGVGGGIGVFSGTVSLRNTIVAGNRLPALPSFAPDVWGAFVSEGCNLIGRSDGSTGFTPAANGDIIGFEASPVDPFLSTLANNGGFTQTHALQPGSPAYDAGDDSLTGTDQRGQPRLLGAHVDIGAFESSELPNLAMISFSTMTTAAQESAGIARVIVRRTSDTRSLASVQFTTTNGTAIAGLDYSPLSGALAFAPGQTEATIEVPILNDSLSEGLETFQIQLTSASSNSVIAANSTHTVQIVDDEIPGTLRFASAGYSVAEGQENAVITIERTEGANGTVSASWTTANGSATAGSDFSSSSGNVTFGPGITQRTITVPILNDSAFEPDETFTVTLSNPTGGATLDNASVCTITIQSEDSPPTLNFSPAGTNVSEATSNALIKIHRSGSLAEAVSVSYQTSEGTASMNSDFVAATGTITFLPFVAEQTIVVPILDDDLEEAAETFTLTLTSPTNGAVLGSQSSHMVTILDDDAPAMIAFANGSISVEEATSQLFVTVIRSGSTALAATVDISANDGTASSGSDYSFVNSTITFPAGATQQTATVSIINDFHEETNETFSLVLSNATGAILGSQSRTVTIVDDDAPAIIAFANGSTSVDEASGQVSVTVVRSGNISQAATVDISANDGTASSGSDYSFINSTITFPAGASQQTAMVSIHNDENEENDEMFTLVLSNPGAGTSLGSQTSYTITILDDAADLSEIRKASYRGLAESVETATPEFAGITVKVTSNNRLTGALQIRGKTLRLQGKFSEARKFSQEFPVQLQRGFSGGNLELVPDEGGRVLRGTYNCSDGTALQIEARREVIGTRSNPVSEANPYNALLETGLAGQPAGFLRIAVLPAGRISILGMLPDGTRLRSSSHIADDGTFACFVPCHARLRGYLAGRASVALGNSLPLSGNLAWQKPASAGEPYATGLAHHSVELLGAVYTRAPQSRILDDFNPTGAGRLRLNVGSSAGGFDVPFSWNQTNTATVASPNPMQARIAIQPRSGIFSGRFRDESGRFRRFHGICVQHPDSGEDLAAGFSVGVTTSDRVELLPIE